MPTSHPSSPSPLPTDSRHPFWRRILFVGLAVLLPLLILLALKLSREVGDLQGQAESSLRHQAQSLALDTGRSLDVAQRMLDMLAARPEVRALDAQACKALLELSLQHLPGVASAGIVDRQGRAVCAAGATTVTLPPVVPPGPASEWIPRALQAHGTVRGLGGLGGPARLGMARPLLNEGGGPAEALLWLSLDTRELTSHWPLASLPEGGTMELLDGAGQVLMRPHGTLVTPGTHSTLSLDGDFGLGMDQTRPVYYAISTVPGTDWKAVVMAPVDTFQAPAAHMLRNSLGAAALATTLSALLAWVLARRMGRPLDALADAGARAGEQVQQLAYESERFNLAVASGNVWAWELRTHHFHLPRQVLERLGYTGDAVASDLAQRWWTLVHPGDRRRLTAAVVEHLKHRTEFNEEFRVYAADGAEHWLHSRGQAQWDDNGRALQMAGTVINVSQRRRAERDLHHRDQQLAGIVETTMDAIVSIDASQRIKVFNRAACQMFRISQEDALGQPLERFIPMSARAAHGGHVAQFARAGTTSRRMGSLHTLSAVRADGEEFPIEASISRSGEGPTLLMTAVVRDMSQARAAEHARQAQAVAEGANSAKAQFLAHMSHELRTPLNAILGMTRLMRDDGKEPLGPSQQQRVALSEQAGQHLLGLIEDVFAFSRIEAGQLTIAADPVSVPEVIASAISFCASDAARYGVTLGTEGPIPALHARADEKRLRQVLVNLLSNGAKYNRPGGEVRVSVGVGEDSCGDQLSLRIRDTGLGMEAEQLAQLFQPFNRLGRENGRIEGTGIGLSLSRQLVERMGGQITVSSEPGVGSCFEVRLPCATPADASQAVPSRTSGAPPLAPLTGTVLYVEDEPINRLVMEQFFARWPGVELLMAETGAQALQCAREHALDLVLLDMNLPDATGLDVLAALRADEQTRHLPVIMASATGSDEDRSKATQAGADAYWTKPLDFEFMRVELSKRLPSELTHV